MSNNTALTWLLCYVQKRNGLKVKRNSEGYYEVNMRNYVSHPENIDADSISPQPVSYNKESGIITFSEPIRELRYNYITHSPNNDLMNVTITNPMIISALERSQSGTVTNTIIRNITDDSYIGLNGYPLTESTLYYYEASDYGKSGLAADGNSRLILRVQTDKPGTVSFSFNEDIGAKLESLSRKELTASDQLNTTKINSNIHQVSAVLVAPERFPEDKNFPSDTFKIHVKFTDEDGEITEDDLELKIEAAPVMLIHGLWGSAEKTFGGESGPGIWHQLKESSFTVGVCNYDGAKSPGEILAEDYSRLYLRLWDMFDKYSERGIVCTKADIVAFGLGGLLTEKYLSEERKDSYDGNNWSVWSYKRGMVRRLITVATPHYGTRWADLITSAPGKVLSAADTTAKITSPINLPLRLLMNALMAGNKAFADSQSGLRELCTDTARDYVFPSGVPMYAVYGDVSNLVDEDGIISDAFRDIALESAAGINIITSSASLIVPAALFAVASIPALAAVAPAMITFAPAIALAVTGAALAYEAKDAIKLLTAEAVKVFNIAMFDDDGHDLAVSIHSAAGGFGSASRGYDGWQYRHWSLPKRDDVGRDIVSLLKGSSDNFKTFGADDRGAILAANKSAQYSENNDSTESLRFIEALNLKITADDSNNAKFTVTAENSTSYDVYCAVCGGEWVKLFKVPSADGTGRKFEAVIPLASDDIESVNAFCFSHNPGDSTKTSLLISNVAQVSDDSDEETPPEILTETLSSAITNQPYSLQLKASGTTPITWTHTGKLPAGLSLSESGLISGTPTKAGKSSFTVTAQNSYGKISKPFTIQTFDPVSITTASLKAGTIGKSYNVTMRAKGSKTITWSAEGLPNGLSINDKGKISGKPTEYGNFSVKITAQNGAGSITKNLQLEIKAIAPKLSGSLAKPTLNQPYSSSLKVTGSTPIIWSVEGKLPGGLTLDSSTGIISGTPASYDKSGYKITITASNDAGIKSKKITLKVKGTAPKITSKLPGATAGQHYSAEITAAGRFSADLPEFLTLDGNIIAGIIPESKKSFKIKIYASNPVRQNVSKSFTIKVSAKKSLPQNLNAHNDTGITETKKGVNPEVIVNVPDPSENSVNSHSESVMIAAELGEISCDMAEIYDFEVEIPDCQLEGSELVYIANSDSPSEDDSIAEFFDGEGNEISEVPESRKIIVSVWLNPERIYRPVIAVKR